MLKVNVEMPRLHGVGAVFFISNSVVTQGEHWFVCTFDCKTRPEDFVVNICETMDTHDDNGKLSYLVRRYVETVDGRLGQDSFTPPPKFHPAHPPIHPCQVLRL